VANRKNYILVARCQAIQFLQTNDQILQTMFTIVSDNASLISQLIRIRSVAKLWLCFHSARHLNSCFQKMVMFWISVRLEVPVYF
jgi:hypothetical protein